MTMWITVPDELHEKLKEQKGTKSFATYIEEVITKNHKQDTIVGLITKVNSLEQRHNELEEFVKSHSGGEYS